MKLLYSYNNLLSIERRLEHQDVSWSVSPMIGSEIDQRDTDLITDTELRRSKEQHPDRVVNEGSATLGTKTFPCPGFKYLDACIYLRRRRLDTFRSRKRGNAFEVTRKKGAKNRWLQPGTGPV